MKNKMLLALLLATGLTVTLSARDDRDRRNDKRDDRPSASSRRDDRSDHDRRRERERESRRDDCEPVVFLYPTQPVYYGYYAPTFPCFEMQVPGRFYPVPIPARPVFILRGMP